MHMKAVAFTSFRRENRKPAQDGRIGRPVHRGRRGGHHAGIYSPREQTGTRVFKNSPENAQRGNVIISCSWKISSKSEPVLTRRWPNIFTDMLFLPFFPAVVVRNE